MGVEGTDQLPAVRFGVPKGAKVLARFDGES